MPTPAQDLEAIQQAREAVLSRAHWPVAYHLTTAALAAVVVAVQALPDPWPAMTASLVAIAALLMAEWSRRRFGFFVNGWRRGKTLWVSVGMLIFILAGTVVALLRHRLGLPPWTPYAAAAGVFVTTFVAGRLWERVYRAELSA
jgi:hypothetical protein